VLTADFLYIPQSLALLELNIFRGMVDVNYLDRAH